ncbi:MAG TPA: SDR family NAD(P)-dependent oxidoreductase [Acidobacteriota bacterium]|nr:SDR family NAD(P)-dependent oxidoreductase [Acidobacteriota bacterium]
MITDRILEGRFALVTGSSRGIGKAIATTLGEHGCNVAVTSRKLQDAQAVATDIADNAGVRTMGTSCEVSKPSSVRELFREIRQWASDRLDVLVCNAGYPFLTELWETPLHATPSEKLESWYLNLFQTDTMGSVFCTFEALPLMMAARKGSIIYLSSTPAVEGYMGTPYTVAKAGILGLMKDVAREYGSYNIRANAFALGNIKTSATFESLAPETQQALAQESPLKRWGEPEEVGRAALFLASDLSSFVTGQTLVVDGGSLRR